MIIYSVLKTTKTRPSQMLSENKKIRKVTALMWILYKLLSERSATGKRTTENVNLPEKHFSFCRESIN